MFCISSTLNHYSEDYIFPIIVVFYTLSVWHFLLVYFALISLSVKYSLVKCFHSTFLIYDLWDCISQSDSVSYLHLQTRATFSAVSQAQNFTFVSPLRSTPFSTVQALKDLPCHVFMFLSSTTSTITFLLELSQAP